ncbi:MAG: phosphotransacetylase family protein, partial [Chloroflexi bacterium]|nr:phosphotransacetylase family protein [Chloroflexota bacterium]
MIPLYVVSTESFSGKTSLCYGIAARLKRDGRRVGYFRPLVFFGKPMDGRVVSEDALFMRQALGLAESTDVIAPAVLDALAIENAAAGRPNDYTERIDRAFAQVARDKDLVVVEGAATLSEGTLLGLGPRQMAERLNARVLAVAKYGTDLVADELLAGREQFGGRWLGAVLNDVPPPRIDFVTRSLSPVLDRRGVFVFAVLPQERLLLSITVDEIADIMGAEVLNSPEHGDELVENIMVGAMSVDSALAYFRRKPNKAVITGGDRADIALAALETSTRCLVLTGNLRPNPLILGRAEELGVPLILARQDTLSAVE